MLSFLLVLSFAGFDTYNPPNAHNGDLLDDIVSRCTREEVNLGYSSDKLAFCHELTHQLNNSLRNKKGRGYNCAYVGKGKYVTLKEPNVTLSQVAKNIPREHRENHTYQLYLVQQQQYWNNQPLYILDEWSAYVNTVEYAKQIGREYQGSDKFSIEFLVYTYFLVKTIEENDPNYQDLGKLKEFYNWQRERMKNLLGE